VHFPSRRTTALGSWITDHCSLGMTLTEDKIISGHSTNLYRYPCMQAACGLEMHAMEYNRSTRPTAFHNGPLQNDSCFSLENLRLEHLCLSRDMTRKSRNETRNATQRLFCRMHASTWTTTNYTPGARWNKCRLRFAMLSSLVRNAQMISKHSLQSSIPCSR
jgi:hypothetical protein